MPSEMEFAERAAGLLREQTEAYVELASAERARDEERKAAAHARLDAIKRQADALERERAAEHGPLPD